MPSRSKKQSKRDSSTVSSSPSSSPLSAATSSFISRLNQDPENELKDEHYLLALEEASRKFPSLIGINALIGRIANNTDNFAADEMLKNKGAIWASKSALDAHSMKPNSLVSVSLAPSSKSFGSQPLCSLLDECARNLGLAMDEEFADEAGSFFALATIFSSDELVKSDVLMSPSLLLTIGRPSSGRVVFIHPVQEQPSVLNEHCRTQGAMGSGEIHLSLALLRSNSTVDGDQSSGNRFLDVVTNCEDENGKISSLRTPMHLKSKFSTGSGKSGAENFEESRTDSSHLKKTSLIMSDVREMLDDESVRKILQACTASWLESRSLLIGNVVVIPVLSGLCPLLVVGSKNSSTDIDVQNMGKQSGEHSVPRNPDFMEQEYVTCCVGRRTKVFFLLPGTSSTPRESPFHGDVADAKAAGFSKLAGLDKEYDELKEIIVSSAVKGVLGRMGLRPTKGVLIHGPPGTGKTSLARLCAHDAGVHLFTVNGPEIVTQYYGESERALHEVFGSASKALPAVVFIDELDAIAPARKDGSEELSQRLVATFLNLMDGISRTDGIVVIAATNRPDSIDPALRRPGRLDREIEIGVPSPKQRSAILCAILSEMEHCLTDGDLAHLAGATHGFVGADLGALCNEAALVCLRRYVSFSNWLNGYGSYSSNASSNSCSNNVAENSFGTQENEDSLEEDMEDLASTVSKLDISATTEVTGSRTSEMPVLSLTMDDFERARMKIRPSAMREVILEVPKVRWDDIGGQKEVKMQLMEAVEWPQKHQDAFNRIGTQPPTGVLLFGPPGCSKTLLARAVASEAGLNFLAVKGPELFSKWVGESEKAVASLFAKARANAPSIIFFDEIDGLAVVRGKESDGVSVSDRVMSQLLIELDGLHRRVNVTVIGATNRPDKIDPALLRPGRFDRLIFVGPPDKNDREDIFRVHLGRMPSASDVCLEELALLTVGFTGADISLVCREAAIAAIEENFNASEITMEHLKTAVLKVQPSDVQSYGELSNRFQRLVHSKNDHFSNTELSPSPKSRCFLG